MTILVLFALTLLFLCFMSLYVRSPPFLSLLSGALLFGLASGMGTEEVILAITGGIGKVFGLFAIIILCGAVIAKTLQAQGALVGMVEDIRRRVKNPFSLSALAGYIFSLPLTCCITAFVMLSPVMGELEKDKRERNFLLYLTAAGSVLSYTVVYPTPVIIPLFIGFGEGLSPLLYDLVAVPLSLSLLAGMVVFFRSRSSRDTRAGDGNNAGGPAESAGKRSPRTAWRAWAPFIAILFSIPLFSLVLHLSHGTVIQAAMGGGMATALLLAPGHAREAGILQGTRHAGVIMFDICGAGAMGSVVLQSGFPGAVFPAVTGILPAVLIPFTFTAIIQAAQGSRVSSAVIASEVMAGSTIAGTLGPLPLVLSLAAGTCVISFLTDPYFWLLQRTTGEPARQVVLSYTLPLLAGGLVILCAALGLHYVLCPGT
ncbi:MAG: hypothetical protein NQU46_08550 [Methanolinea sp.]|nr:hypothetical protein [Methanolinea sp.]